MARRDEILAAVLEADRLHQQFDSEARVARGDGRINVFEMLVSKKIPVIFRPLRNLLGAYIDDPDQGVMVTTQRQLPVQRFTAAHELGHAMLRHEASFDDEEVLTRALFTRGTYDPREIQANAFASELLTPQWLIVHHMTRQGWTRDDLKNPDIVYQLALRMGSSFSATCYVLAECKGIDRSTWRDLSAVKLRKLKESLVTPYEPDNWYGDVWVVTERDNGMVLEGSRSDIVVLKIQEHTNSGYVWQFSDLQEAGLAIRDDDRISSGDENIGGIVSRTVIAEAQGGARGDLNLREIRPWEATPEPLNLLKLRVDFTGPVSAGLLPTQREALLGTA